MKKLLIGLLAVCFSIMLVACEVKTGESGNSQDNNPQSQSVQDTTAGTNSTLPNVTSGEASSSAKSSYNTNSLVNSNKNSTVNSSSAKPASSSGTTSGNYSESEQKVLNQANNAIDWQLDNGGWGKNVNTTVKFTSYPSDSWKVNGKVIGTIDNNATVNEIRLLAQAYDISKDKKYKDSFDKGMKFLKNLQYPTGGFAQVYPHRGNYSDYVTFNDDAMVHVLTLLQDMVNNKTPFKNVLNDQGRKDCATMVEKGIDYILKSQITVKGEKSAWCAQHDPKDYKPLGARSYELASVSGSESVGIIKFLLTQKDNQKALEAAESARVWLVKHRIDNMTYSKKNPPYFFTESKGSYVWYRFYSLEDGRGFYCTRKGKIYYDIKEFYDADKAESGKEDRSTGYDWAGNWLFKAGLNY